MTEQQFAEQYWARKKKFDAGKISEEEMQRWENEMLAALRKSKKKKGAEMKIKYAIDNLIDIIDGACNCYMLVYVIVCIITITDQKVVPFGVLKDWVNVGAILALIGMIFIPSKDQRKEMKQKD